MHRFFAQLATCVFLSAVSSSLIYAQITFTEYLIDGNFGGPAGIYSCDLDGDEDNDVIAAAANDNEVAWWRNDGGDPINWTKQTIDSSFSGAIFVHAADVDHDDDIDILGAAWYGHEIAWWRNDGGEPIDWTKQTIDNSYVNAHEVLASDLDRDGDIDVLGASAGGNTITWWRNDGGDPIQWSEQTIGQNFHGARSVAIEDIDGDNDKDVLGAALTSNEIIWWRNDGGEPIEWTEFTISDAFAGAHMVRTADFDGDGNPDVLGTAYMDRDIAWWRNDGGDPLVWTRQTIDGNLPGAVTAFPADIDGDGDPDVLGAGQDSNRLAWYRNDGGNPIEWARDILTASFGGAWPAYAIDLNGDETTDLLCGGNSADEIRWWRNDGPTGIIDQATPETSLPRTYALGQNYPNPFNPSTTIQFVLSSPSQVKLKVYDIAGRLVKRLVDGKVGKGTHSIVWDGKNDRGQTVSSGVYLYKLTTEDFVKTKRMILLK
jgi:hypothetical protein